MPGRAWQEGHGEAQEVISRRLKLKSPSWAMPSQSARSAALAIAVESPTIRIASPVCDGVRTSTTTRSATPTTGRAARLLSNVSHPRDDHFEDRTAPLAEEMYLVDDHEADPTDVRAALRGGRA